ncbi:DUF397 domain-containing protein [Streptomyces sp. NPDC004539]|uniref:DUF397 domain-containing protein n=1 Tax=Streptomyces sp. NPDC004539 TaxID=3154280 RepID=UPI0033B7E8FD
MAIQLGATERWTTSSYTGANGACLMVRSVDRHALDVGDTKVPTGPAVTFFEEAWNTFVESVK